MHRFTMLAVLATTGIIVAPGVHAVTTYPFGVQVSQDTSRITLDEALALFEQNSAQLRLAEQRAVTAQASIGATAAFPNPSVSFAREQLAEQGLSYHETTLSVSQPLGIGGQRGLRRTTHRLRAEAETARLETIEAALRYDVMHAFVSAAAAEASLAALHRVVAGIESAFSSVSARVEAGDASEFERNRLGVERLDYLAQLQTATVELGIAARQTHGTHRPGAR